jgi:SAM-dependent methyltransferase
MKQTGERPIEDSTPAALIALHDAGYREVSSLLPDGVVLDIGCGVGDESVKLGSQRRRIVGVDYHRETAVLARDRGVAAVCADGGVLPFASGSFDAVCSSHIIEHFSNPTDHVAEMARVTRDDGVVCVVTPNEPADFENPYHVHLFRPDSLRELLATYFDEVELCGLDGDDEVRRDFAARRRMGRRLLALDVFGLRHRLPRSWFVALHAIGRRLLYPFYKRRESEQLPITQDRFALTPDIDDDTLVLFAVARKPRR